MCTPRAITCGTIVTSTLSAENHKAVTEVAAVVLTVAVMEDAIIMPVAARAAKVEEIKETKDKAIIRMLDVVTGQTPAKISKSCSSY